MSKKIRVGVWGLGRAGGASHTREVQANSDLLELAVVCDADRSRAEEYSKKCNVPFYTDQADLLADKTLDLIAVCTRSIDHIRHARMVLEAGFAVYIEKPLAASYAEAQELVELDRKYPGKVFVRLNRRFEPCFQHICEIIDSGLLGKVHTIKLARNGYTRRDDWQTLIKNNGGQLNNWGPHLIDHALQFLKYKVDSVWGDLKLVAAQGDAEDCFKIILRGNDGMTVDIENFAGNAFPGNIYEVYGDRGALISSDEQDLKMRYIEPDYALKQYQVNDGQPNGYIFADTPQLPWRRVTIMVEPKLKVNMNSSYRFIAEDMLEGKPYPIKLTEALEIIKICDIVKSQSPIYNKELKK